MKTAVIRTVAEHCGIFSIKSIFGEIEGLKMIKIVAVYGSPRRKGNTSLLFRKAVQGAEETGAKVEEIVLRDLNISPCLEIYGCKETGRCVIEDDFHRVLDKLQACQGIILASPIFFYAVSAQTKILIDRCQSMWVKKYWIEKIPYAGWQPKRKGLFISVGATKGKKLFDGALLTIKYFFEVLDTELWKALLHRSLDFEGDVLNHPEYLEEAYKEGKKLCRAIEILQK